jgi:hypothetical protein
MFETLKYLVGSAGASGYGSKSTAEQVTENCCDLHSITAIITGEFFFLLSQKRGLKPQHFAYRILK